MGGLRREWFVGAEPGRWETVVESFSSSTSDRAFSTSKTGVSLCLSRWNLRGASQIPGDGFQQFGDGKRLGEDFDTPSSADVCFEEGRSKRGHRNDRDVLQILVGFDGPGDRYARNL